jgi:hypothetical protein
MIPTLGRTRSTRRSFGSFGDVMTRGQAESTTMATADQVARLIDEAEAARRAGNWAQWAMLSGQAARIAATAAGAGSMGTGTGTSNSDPGEQVMMTRDGPMYSVGPTYNGRSSSDVAQKPSGEPGFQITVQAEKSAVSPWVWAAVAVGGALVVFGGVAGVKRAMRKAVA